MLKIYHIRPLLLVFILLLTSCAVHQPIDQDGHTLSKDTFRQSNQQSKILRDQALQQLKETQPDAYQFYLHACVAEIQGEPEVAIEAYHNAMQEDPENSFLLTSLGLAYLRNEDIIPARRYLLKAVNLKPDDYQSHLGLGYIYLQDQQFKSAVAQIEVSLQLLPTLEGVYLLAKVEEAQGHFQKAKQLYQTVVQVDRRGQLGEAAATHLRSLSK